MNLTLFDLDGTLLPTDSDHAFGEFLVRIGWADAGEFKRRNDEFYAQYLDGGLDIEAYVQFCTSPWRERDPAEIAAAQARFVDEYARPSLHPQALALVRGHLDAGDLVAVVTATNDFVTRPIATLFGVDTLIATELDRDDSGRATGAIRGVPSFRDGKITRVRQWLAESGRTLADFGRSTFYSDSTNDLPLLELVSHPVATNPGPGLRTIAEQRGWPILELF
ncbi:histidinol-phosphatase [Rubrivivax gelatinosus]|uniref:Phosphoserine phosphatase n=1 Tax=Rubrivivax gelatinosus TaxID=28068 RepID=A0ABS1DUA7_RUBGE|nr:HAD family hydrolase [Rubrivivax gelatinosus]MBK1713200.1 phosphoserine phosphatase [Rubrivivax gelatinosus]